MSNFTPKKLDENLINEGQQYKSGDVVQPIAINDPIEAILLLQEKTAKVDDRNTFTSYNFFYEISAYLYRFNIGTEICSDNNGNVYLNANNNGIIVTEPILQSATNELYQRVQPVEKQLKEQSKDIQNLYAIARSNKQYAIAEVEQAYSARQTADGENIIDGAYATVTKIAGHTAKCENLVPFPYNIGAGYGNTRTINGITYSFDENGVITINGTANENGSYLEFARFKVPKGTYTFSGAAPESALTVSRMRFLAQGGVGKTVDIHSKNPTHSTTLDSDVVYSLLISVEKGVTVNNLKYKPMLNKGATALPYQRYFTDLKPSYFKAIKSTGHNLIPYYEQAHNELPTLKLGWVLNSDGTATNSGITVKKNQDGTITFNGTATKQVLYYIFCTTFQSTPSPHFFTGGDYTLSGVDNRSAFDTYHLEMRTYDPDGSNPVYRQCTSTVSDRFNLAVGSYSDSVHVVIRSGYTMDNVTIRPMLNRGSIALPYEPPIEDSVNYANGSTELHAWDYILPKERKTIRQTVLCSFSGSEDWAGVSWTTSDGVEYAAYRFNLPTIADKKTLSTPELYAITNYIEVKQWSSNSTVGSACRFMHLENGDAGQVYFYFRKDLGKNTTLDEFRAYLNELYVANKPLSIAYKADAPVSESYIALDKPDYIAYVGGDETVDDGGENNALYGSEPTVTQEYFELIGGEK